MPTIEIQEIKREVLRIDRSVTGVERPLLLIGGLAVNQYCPTRQSEDIDLICGHDRVLQILQTVYGNSAAYNITDENQNAYRPDYIITFRSTGAVIKFGPKLLERHPYPGLEWETLRNAAKPFQVEGESAHNIYVPSVTHLAYTKLIAFVSRAIVRVAKLRQDLDDFVRLSNEASFSIHEFKDLLAQLDNTASPSAVRAEFLSRVRKLGLTRAFMGSGIAQIAEILLGTPLLPVATISESAYRHYLQISDDEPIIVAHCRGEKFSKDGVVPPGYELMRMIKGAARVADLRDNPLGDERFSGDDYDDGGIDWADLDVKALFLVDSPEYNDYTRYVVKNYRQHMVGGHLDLDFAERMNGRRVQKILLDGIAHVTDKSEHPADSQFGPHKDYLLLMRQPANVLSESKLVPAAALSEQAVVWVVYGITGKGSWAGVHALEFDNLRRLERMIREKGQAQYLPPYFEALFQLNAGSGKITSLDDPQIELLHFSHLSLRRRIVLGDEAPLSIMVTNPHLSPPLKSVHLDPVANCNFRCPKCIEKELKGRKTALSTRQALRIISDVHALGCRELSFYGGEPTLHEDFDLLVRIAYAMGFNIVIVTNGSMLKEPRISQAIVDAKSAIHVRVSLDANSQETFEKAHGLEPGEFDFAEICQSVKSLISEGVSVGISYLLSPPSVAELEDACRYWHKAKAVSFHPRVYMDSHGRLPKDGDVEYVHSRYPSERARARKALRAMRALYGDSWFVMLPWLRAWANEETNPAGILGEDFKLTFQRCYSAMYRIAISPVCPPKAADDQAAGEPIGTAPDFTDAARISFCPYNRDVEALQVDYPAGFRDQWASLAARNVVDAEKIAAHCRDIVCSRVEANQQVEDALG